MSLEHIHDDRLQQLAEKSGPRPSGLELLHLRNCPACRHAVAHYRKIISAFPENPEPELSPRFTENTMKLVSELVPQPAKPDWSIAGMLGLLAVSVIGAIAYFRIDQVILDMFRRSTHNPELETLAACMERATEYTPILVAAVLILALYSLADHIFMKKNGKELSHFSV